jgi:hypothetical protein
MEEHKVLQARRFVAIKTVRLEEENAVRNDVNIKDTNYQNLLRMKRTFVLRERGKANNENQ